MPNTVRFSDDATLFILDDGGVVLCEGTQNLYELNTTATYIWCCCEEGMEKAEIANSTARTFDIKPSEAAVFTNDIIEEWRSLGLLDDSRRPEDRPKEKALNDGTPPVRTAPPGPSPTTFHGQRYYRILGQFFRVRYPSVELEDWVHPVIAHLELEEPATGATDLDIVADDHGFTVMLDSLPNQRCAAIDEVAPLVKACVFFRSMAQESYFLALHAAAVCDGERCLLLPGNAGSGKTSLTAALIASGYRYLSDDLVLLDDESLNVRGLPLSLCVKEGGVDSLTRYHPGLADLPTHLRPDGKRVRYLPPPPGAFDSAPERGFSVRWLVFPRYVPGKSGRLDPIAKADALRRLAALCAVQMRLDTQKVARLVDWIGRVECFEMSQASLPAATDLLRELCQRNPAADS